MARISVHKINSKAERGHPCLIPLDRFTCSVRKPLTFTKAKGQLYMSLIQFKKYFLSKIFVMFQIGNSTLRSQMLFQSLERLLILVN